MKEMTNEDKLKKEIKELKDNEDKLKKELKDNEDELKKEIKELKDNEDKLKEEAKPFIAYKELILTASKAEYDPKDIIDSIKFVAMHIKKKNWEMVNRVGGTSGDLMARGACPKCKINLVGKDLQPRDFTLPCLIEGCTFNRLKTNTGEIS
jgi:DNA repair exonuclease SbcCD ATPase subunit